jgi:AbrB family looped-hinge helix DNA binding protein
MKTAMPIVTVKNKFQIVIPRQVRDQIRVEIGDLFEADVEEGKITLTPKSVVDRHLAEGLEDLRNGRTHGPYSTAKEAVAALESRRKQRGKTSRS